MCLGIPGQIVNITNSELQLGLVNISGVQREVNLACVVNEDHPLDACVGDWVLVHVGFAMSRLDEQEAAATLDLLNQLGEVQEELAGTQTSEA
ncbi:MAG: HypC/HybG/HupF family hydrogenase formation chaperone [Synechococcus sp.]